MMKDRKEYYKEYYARPEVKKRMKKYREVYDKKSEVIARKKRYYALPENRKKLNTYYRKWRKKYFEIPENIKKRRKKEASKEHLKKRREYLARPSVNKNRNKYLRKYSKTAKAIAIRKAYVIRPEVIAKQKQYQQRPEVRKRAYERSKKPENIKKARERVNNKLKNNPEFKITYTLRRRLHYTLKLLGINKSDSTLHLIGCGVAYLMYHIQNQFKKDMHWDNHSYDGWHIDHIMPCASFDLMKPSEQRKCFHYTNLRPLWAKENLSKNANLPKNLISYKWTEEGWVFKWEGK